jgi:hypothetical protein
VLLDWHSGYRSSRLAPASSCTWSLLRCSMPSELHTGLYFNSWPVAIIYSVLIRAWLCMIMPARVLALFMFDGWPMWCCTPGRIVTCLSVLARLLPSHVRIRLVFSVAIVSHHVASLSGSEAEDKCYSRLQAWRHSHPILCVITLMCCTLSFVL